MSEPFLREGSSSSLAAAADNDDNASQRSTSSLLDRIRMQREREKRQQPPPPNSTPSQMQIQVPQYNPVPTGDVNLATGGPQDPAAAATAAAAAGSGGGAFGGGGGPVLPDSGGSSSFFRSAWNDIATSMETGMAGLERGDDFLAEDSHMEDALLMMPTASSRRGGGGTAVDEDYSMCNYFLMFVRDVYLAFVSVPLPGRVILVVAMLYVAIKLL
jgi:hypothetical protein